MDSTPEPSTRQASEESWDETTSQHDAVGERITQLLNEGKVPYFGCPAAATAAAAAAAAAYAQEGFSYPLLSIGNYRAFRRVLSNLFHQPPSNADDRRREQIWFLIETLTAVYITIYSLNDMALRYTSDVLLFGLLSSLIDLHQLQYGMMLLFQRTIPSSIQKILLRWVYITKEWYSTSLESKLMYGKQYHNRYVPWHNKEDEELRIIKFRKKHLRMMQLQKERQSHRRIRRKFRIERKKKERKSIPANEYDGEMMQRLQVEKRRLVDAVLELRRRPPTYFSRGVRTSMEGLDAGGCDESKRHAESLVYCHEMMFGRGKIGVETSSVSANQRRVERLDRQKREAVVEVSIDDFPDINVNIDENGRDDEVSATSSSASKYSMSLHFDYDQDLDHYESEDSEDGSDEDQSFNSDDGDDEDDELSEVSYASEEPVKKMDWIAVGAKIGTKILKSREVHRVISNPSRKLLPQETRNMIEGIQQPHHDLEERLESSLHTSTFESQYSKISTEQDTSTIDTKSTSKSAEALVPKPPKHGLWTSPGSAAKTSSQYGVTLPDSDAPTTKHGERKVYLSSAKEGVELMRESSDGQTIDRVDTDTNPNGYIRSPMRNIHSPYNLRLVNSMPASGFITTTNNLTPKSSNQLRSSLTRPNPATTTSLSRSDSTTRLAPMEKGVKIVVPLFAPNANMTSANKPGFFQMGTVLSSTRITVSSETFTSSSRTKQKWNPVGEGFKDETNCLAIKLVLDKALLRGSKFAEMNIRIMDEWNWVPRFSKYPIGSCVATTFGIGVLVGWRVEDDMHIIRSLWNRSGPGSAMAYLRRECLHSIVEAAIGFDVETRLGSGTVEGYVRGGKEFTQGKYFVHLKSKGRYEDRVIEFKRNQILSCRVAKFIPVTEHIRAAALYQLEILHYKARVRECMLNDSSASEDRQKGTWRKFSEYVDLFAACLSKAIAEDPDFDREVDKFLSHIINVLEDNNNDVPNDDMSVISESVSIMTTATEIDQMSVTTDQSLQWNVGNMQDIFASFFAADAKEPVKPEPDNELVLSQVQKVKEAHDSLTTILRVLLKTVAVARASVPDRPKLHIALAMIHEGLLFIRQVIRVNKNNISKALIEAWFRTLNEISKTFGPLKSRCETLGKKIAKKMKRHSDIAKKRILSFVDVVLGDTLLLHALERGDWRQSLRRIEHALVHASITDEATCKQLHRVVILLYKNLAPRKNDQASKAAAKRTETKALRFAKLMKTVASPGRSFLRLLASDGVLELFGRVLLRVFDNDPEASMMINIYAFNFDSLRYLRTLNNMAISAKLWETILDAIDEELTFVLSEIPEQTKYFVEPFIKLFSLGVAKFHCIQAGDSSADWLDFLMDDDSVKIIQDLDMKLIDCLDAFCKDLKQLFEVMPYIKTLDNDILDLMDELDFDLMFKEITGSICDPEKFTAYITERTAVLVERFLDYLPRMSIPIEKRELNDGWVLTCRGSDGGDLRLSDINVKRENLLCKVLGSENVFQPLGDDNCNYIGSPKKLLPDCSFDSNVTEEASVEEGCVLDEVRETILSAQSHGCWVAGFGGLKEPFFYLGVPAQLEDLPLSDELKTAIDLWQTSAIDDFEFTQIVVRQVSKNIELHSGDQRPIGADDSSKHVPQFSNPFKPFNPKVDATALLLDIKNLTLHLDEFIFRVEKEDKTIFDPVFEGAGSLTVKNVCISLRIEAKKEMSRTTGRYTERPLFQLSTFDISLEKLAFVFKDTGADWVLNTVLKGFRDQITHVVRDNVKEQIKNQVHKALEHINAMFDANHELLLTMLGVSLDDLELIDHANM